MVLVTGGYACRLHPRLLSHHTYGVLFTSNHEMISQYAKHLPFHYTNHLVLQADEIDASGIGLHRKAVLSGHALCIMQQFPYLFPTFSKHTNRNAVGVTGI